MTSDDRVSQRPATTAGGTAGAIEVRIRELGQLFNSLDPSPFNERDLDDEAEAYIVGWARELQHDDGFVIRVHLPAPEAEKARQRGLEEAVTNYFEYRAGMLQRDHRELMRTGWQFLGLGMLLLVACLAIGLIVRKYLLPEPLGSFVEHGLTLLGWVANWRPAEILLYDRFSGTKRIALYRRIAAAQVEIVDT
jgi:hypothetical protein